MAPFSLVLIMLAKTILAHSNIMKQSEDIDVENCT